MSQPIEKTRLQHGRVSPSPAQIVDANGHIGNPWVAEGLLGRLFRNHQIDARAWAAGEEFHRLFQLAALDPLRAADMARAGGGGGPDLAHGSMRARCQRDRAMDVLGGMSSPIGSVAWFVLGEDLTLRQFAMRHGGGGWARMSAMRALTGALEILAVHFFGEERKGLDNGRANI